MCLLSMVLNQKPLSSQWVEGLFSVHVLKDTHSVAITQVKVGCMLSVVMHQDL